MWTLSCFSPATVLKSAYQETGKDPGCRLQTGLCVTVPLLEATVSHVTELEEIHSRASHVQTAADRPRLPLDLPSPLGLPHTKHCSFSLGRSKQAGLSGYHAKFQHQ